MMHADSGIRTIAELQTHDFAIAEKYYSPGTRIARHSHDSFVLSFPLAGSFIESNSLSSYTCEKFGLSINPPGESHANDFSRAAKCLVIASKTDAAARFVNAPVYVRDLKAIGLALRIHRELLHPDDVTALMTQGLILEMLASASRERMIGQLSGPPRWLARVREHIHDNLSETHDLKALSHLAQVHQTTLCRQFRRYYHLSIGEYVRELRICRSMSELAGLDKSLSEIALAAGFYDQSHFANAFKRYTGMTPSEFRRK
jgi:AraC family transcriptional regulator